MRNGIDRDIVSCPAIDVSKSAIGSHAGEHEMLLLPDFAYTPLFAELCGEQACRATREQSRKSTSRQYTTWQIGRWAK